MIAMKKKLSLSITAPLAAVLALVPLSGLGAQQAGAPFTVVETGQGFSSLQQAVDAIGNATGNVAIAPGIYRQCAIQQAGNVSFMATEPGRVIFDGVACEGKAALVLRGRSARVSGIIFQNMEVGDGNGAGIRIEQGNLIVAQSWFRDSQQGILSAQDGGSTIVVDKSTFTRLGTCEFSAGCAHSIYVGAYGHLRVTRSRFEQGRGGHYVKSRSARVDVASSSFDDTAGRFTNYMIDLPAGSVGQITNNWFVQGTEKENHSAFIAVGAESNDNTSNGLRIAGNNARLSPNTEWGSTFVANWSGDTLNIGQNTLGQGLQPYERR
jgi:hypothetical protein